MRAGRQTYIFENPPCIASGYAIVGPKEGEGLLGGHFQYVLKEDLWDEKTFEKCEVKMHREAIIRAVNEASLEQHDIDAVLGADLLNQIVAASYAAKDIDAVFLGMYGACSSFGEALAMGSFLVSGGFMDTVSCSTSSHFSTAERQYRYPLEYGNQRTPTSQWTVTGAGATILRREQLLKPDQPKVRIKTATLGKVIDFGIDDESNMGAAMAPSAAMSMAAHFNELDRSPDYYDAIFTGDLGGFGKELLRTLLKSEGIVLGDNYHDCGAIIYSDHQRPIQGGSGAGCSSAVFNGYLLPKLQKGEIKRLLLCPTGALLNKESPLQGSTIPGITHCLSLEVD